jgi:uncharacterized membrane protein
MKPRMIVTALLGAFVAAITIFLRIPIPKSSGYLNLGDVIIVFTGLYLGPVSGAVVGGFGSAVADAVGYPIFIVPTLIIKGLEGLLSGSLRRRRLALLGPIIGAIVMAGGYFIAEAFMFSGKIGLAAAISELPFNILQGFVGVGGGYAVYRVIRRWSDEDEQHG